ncbi:DNA cytosine methyltransferase [Streptomyces luteireticuli]|uniref:DNA (cytosine-5-)-methyltransferase n=1 Tax=Streptomyces luteireticuli TaxID=173858 RepID=A0ABN0Z7G0_9ACTN
MLPTRFTSLEVCAGMGGQALGLERAGFDPVALIENDRDACATLRANRSQWRVLETDLLTFVPEDYLYDVDLMAAGLPRVKSMATIHKPEDDYERKLLRATVYLAHTVQPRALLIENVPDLATSDNFEGLRQFMRNELEHLGYKLHWNVLNAADFGVPQERKQGYLVALREEYASHFHWPEPLPGHTPTVGAVLGASMAVNGWPHADEWASLANRPAPTIVGGSKNRGGPDLGPTGSKNIWARMGVNGEAVGDSLPDADFPWLPDAGDRKLLPKLTNPQVAALQALPQDWTVCGRKTSTYRQIGHAAPPPVAEAMGRAIATALAAGLSSTS